MVTLNENMTKKLYVKCGNYLGTVPHTFKNSDVITMFSIPLSDIHMMLDGANHFVFNGWDNITHYS